MLQKPVDEIVDNLDPNYQWAGDTEQERAKSMTRFVRLRSIIQRGQAANAILGDDTDLLLTYLKGYLIPKVEPAE